MEKPADGHLNGGGSLKIVAIDDLRKDPPPNNEDIVEEIEVGKDTNKSSAVLDEFMSDEVKSQYHVLQQGDEIYDATLNQTNISGNYNKFYIIQALESNDGSTFMVYNRWGMIGTQGRDTLHGPYTDVQSAIYEFEEKFKDKTNNRWSNRKQFVSQSGFYTWFEMNYGTGDEIDIQGNLKRKLEIELLETKLEKRVAEFIALICNASMMEKQMTEIGYNAKKRPLRRLNKAMISKIEWQKFDSYERTRDETPTRNRMKVLKQRWGLRVIDSGRWRCDAGDGENAPMGFTRALHGRFSSFVLSYAEFKSIWGYEVLKKVAYAIGLNNTRKLRQLSEEFYTIIPHDFGYKDMREFIIDTPQKLKLKLEMVEALGEIEVASKLLKETAGMEEDRLLSGYERLHCELTPIEVDSKEFHMIKKYMKNTHAKAHSNYTVEIVQIFKASRHGEVDRFSEFSSVKNRMLLWHGSRLTNWVGILSEGLRIAPPEAPVTGYMFGKGVYFADMFSKSANYCHASQHASHGVLLLCEVALGEMAELQTANHDADKLPQGKLSTKGVGATSPDMSMIETLENGVVVPLGNPKKQLESKVRLLHNEYIVYNVDQIRMRYVVHVNFTIKKHVTLEMEE
ncbi:hypothetical protein LXL04_001310 [Taraxacum kok-saghyz]